MEVNIITPFMMRLNGMLVDECPKFLTPHSTMDNHLLFLTQVNITIPLELYGIDSFIPSRPTCLREVYSDEVHCLTLTREHLK